MKKLHLYFVLLILPWISQIVKAQTLASTQVSTPKPVPMLHSQEQQKSLENVLLELESAYKVSIVYKSELVENKMVQKFKSLHSIDETLKQLLQPFKLAFKKDKNVYVIVSRSGKEETHIEAIENRATVIFSASETYASGSGIMYNLQKGVEVHQIRLKAVTVSGKVTDDAGAPLPGVNVLLKGTTNGTTTNANGAYSLTIPEGNNILIFSYIGYTTEEVAVNNRTVIDVSLKPDVQSLSEVVVIGYGEKTRALLTESIGTVNAGEIQKLPVASPDAAIQGRISGVQVTSVDGTPGSPVAIRVRGVGTVGNSQPLFVIDGIPVGNPDNGTTNPLTTINSSDIESISVLKDASAAAVYGVRAANGVVLITTKRGKTGKPTINFDGYYGVQNFPKLYDWNNTQQYVQITQEALEAKNTQQGLKPGDKDYEVLHPDLRADNPNNVLGINSNWQDEVLNRNAPIQNYNLSVAGGNEGANYHISVGYFGQDAMIRKWDLDRYTFRANSDYKIGKRFRFGQTFSVAYQEIVRGMNAGGDGFLFAGTANMPPFFSIYDDPNNPIPGNRYGFSGNLNRAGLTIANQLGINQILDNRDRLIRMLGGVYGELQIIDGLTFKSAASLDLSLNRNTGWQPGYTGPELGLARDLNNFNDGRGEGYTQVFTNTLTFDRTFGDHSINALAGIEYQKLRGNGLSYGGSDYQSTNPAFYQSVKNQQGVETVVGQDADGNDILRRLYANAGSSLFNDAFVGYVGRLSYDFRDKYLLTATFRRDGSARFAPENRWGNFPSVSAAWRVSEEAFFDAIPFISDLKVRASWGQLGNANTAFFPYVFRVSFTPDYGLGGSSRQAPTQAIFPNREVGWETVETTDFGIDVSFFNNKVNLLATYYYRNTKDFLYGLPIPFISGFGSTSVNAGNVLNRGIELELGYSTRLANGIQFDVSGNLTTVNNKLTALAPGIEEFASGDYRTAVGYPIGYFYGYQTAGIYQTANQAAEAIEDKVSGNKPVAGDVIFVDNNGPAPKDAPKGQLFSGTPDGVITTADRTYLGKTIPDFYYGLSLSANFKGFDLSALFQGVSGIQVYNAFRRGAEGLGAYGRNQFTTTANRWTGEGTSNSMPRATANDLNRNNRFSDRWIEDAGFFRLRNLQVGYSLPKSLLGKTKAFSGARIYLGASNLFRITKYTGLDPEVMTYGSSGYQTGAGTDNANIPQPVTYQAGFQFQF
jgi:TonB-linked SusC/RagA family outer membrane protein